VACGPSVELNRGEAVIQKQAVDVVLRMDVNVFDGMKESGRQVVMGS
jgi:hypothetical protein